MKDWCSYCGLCASICVRNCIDVKEYALIFNNCTHCEICVNACPLGALEMKMD